MGNKRIYLGRESSKYAKIAGGAVISVTSLFFVLMAMGFEISGSDDVCLGTLDDPCISYGKICNLGPDNYDIYNPDEIDMDFSPTIKDYWIFFKDGRVKKEMLYDLGVNASTAGWRYENFTEATKSRSDVLYVHRFARYSCQEYMLVGLKENPDDVIKWGVGVGNEYLDPFWYGEGEDNATISAADVNLELGSKINISANLTGSSEVCVDIDHPDYGYNYSCGTAPLSVSFNISYFQDTEFSDGDKKVYFTDDEYLINNTATSTGAYYVSTPRQQCVNLTLDFPSPSRLYVQYYVWDWEQNVNYYSDTVVNPNLVIRDNNLTVVETIEDSDFDDDAGWSYVSTNNLYESGQYGICLDMPFALKMPIINTTSVGPVAPATGWQKFKDIDIGYNYYINYSTSIVSSNNAFCTNSVKHVFNYTDGTAEEIAYTGLCIESGTFMFDNPNRTKQVDHVEVWLNRQSGSGGLSEYNTTIMYANQGATIKFQNSNEYGWGYTYYGSSIPYPQSTFVRVQNNSKNISSHTNSEVMNLSFNVSASNDASDVYVYIGDTEVAYIGNLYSTTSGEVTELNEYDFDLLNPDSTYFSIPKEAMVTNASINFTGGNTTWATNSYVVPNVGTGVLGSPSHGTAMWLGKYSANNPDAGYDGSLYWGVRPWLDPLYDIIYYDYLYENYTKDSNAIYGKWYTSHYNDNSAAVHTVTKCWSGSSWTTIFDSSGYVPWTYGQWNPTSYYLPSGCFSQDILQIQTILQYGDGTPAPAPLKTSYYLEGGVYYYRYGYPENMSIEVGLPDGSAEYSGSGELTGSDSADGFEDAINTYLETCTADSNGFCTVPIYFTSADGGLLTVDNISIEYTYDPNPIEIDIDYISDYLDEQDDGFVEIPLTMAFSGGPVKVSALRFNYAGGNFTNHVFVRDHSSMLYNQLIDSFSGETIPINFTYTDQTLFAEIPRNGNVTYAAFNLSGYNNTRYCYQETANVSTDCGGLDTGAYQDTDSSWYNSNSYTLYDGNPATGTRSYSGGQSVYVNYTKPTGASNDGTLWQVVTTSGAHNVTINSLCWALDPLQLRMTSVWGGYYTLWSCWNSTDWISLYQESGGFPETYIYEEGVWWNITALPGDVNIFIGEDDGSSEWNMSGYLSNNITSDLSSAINSVVDDGCNCEDCEYTNYGSTCKVPFIFNSSFVGDLEISSMNISYDSVGNISVNDTFTILSYYSKFINAFPSFINYLEFIPKSGTSKNVTPYGQSESRPIFNITPIGYGGKDTNLSLYVNTSLSCVNITMSNTPNKEDGFMVNESWIEFNSSITSGESIPLWLWVDLNCSYPTWYYFNPDFYFRGCCEDCICSEDLV